MCAKDLAGSAWFDERSLNRRSEIRLVCFGHAGASTVAFAPWPRLVPESVDVCAVCLPGRGRRMGEPNVADFHRLLPALVDGILPLLNRPYALFGHSLGALIAFEVARIAPRQGVEPPVTLIVSGRGAPHRGLPEPRRSALPTAAFSQLLRDFKGTPEAILQDRELLDVMEPILRADFSLNETYRYADNGTLTCPILAIGGAEDPGVTPEKLHEWGQLTSGAFSCRMFPGGHFFFLGQEDKIVPPLINHIVRQSRRKPESQARAVQPTGDMQ